MLPRLKELRRERDVSQQRLADAIFVTQSSINKYENHNIEPESALLIRIADYFDTSVDYLIGHTNVRRRIEPVEAHQLNAEEASLMDRFRRLSAEERNCLHMTAEAFLKNR